jgi:Protein affecting phage T7 exclusion by the F plasmid
MRLRYVFLLLLLIPLADALFLVVVADYLGWQATVALVVLTAIVGMFLVRAEGRSAITRLQTKVARGESPANELVDGGLLIAAGAFLLTPGLVTDTIGFLFGFPLSRVPIRAAVKRFVVLPVVEDKTGGFASGNVYIGGFPGSDAAGGSDSNAGSGNAGMGGLGGVFGGDDFPGGQAGGANSGTPSDRTDQEQSDEDVVDVDYTVEESDS